MTVTMPARLRCIGGIATVLTVAGLVEAESGDAASAASCRAGDATCSPGVTEASGPDYFKAYGTAYVQAEMLQDDTRTEAFRDAILKNKDLFAGKTVLDVGAGTGILSLFAARAGAARVFAVERSDMALIARKIVSANGFNSTIEVVHGLLEEVKLPVQSVDIIVSEWIGTLLIHESMLDSVLFARDKWLAPGGFILPDTAALYLAGIHDQHSEYVWNDFHGFDFTPLGTAWRHVAAQQCAIRRTLTTEPVELMTVDLYNATAADTEFSRRFRLVTVDTKEEWMREIYALVSWFTIGFFSSPWREKNGVESELTTHPDSPCTHWQQTFMFMSNVFQVPDGGLDGSLRIERTRGSPRDLDVIVSLGGQSEETFTVAGAEC